MSVLGKCDSCGQLDNCMLYPPAKKWLCDECWSEYERFDEEYNEPDECDHCGSRFHSTFRCDYDEYEA